MINRFNSRPALSEFNNRLYEDKRRVGNNVIERAIVIGGSIAGLTTAKVLSHHVRQVIILDRDHLVGSTDFRHGVPQARHAHTLLPHGQVMLEKLFPGLVDELFKRGAVPIDPSREKPYYQGGKWRMANRAGTKMLVSSSRPLLEQVIRERVTRLRNVRIILDQEVIGLQADETGKHVAGVRLRSRGSGTPLSGLESASLVVDASGRNSQAPAWLDALGFTPPEEWRVNSFVGYTSRMYRKPIGFDAAWKALYINPEAPSGTRGAILLPMEEDLWCVTLIGVGQDYPPITETGFEDFARSLPTRVLFDALAEAEPLTHPVGFRRTENRVRRYDQLPNYLEGFLVAGDAVFAMNPLYAQGMVAAATGSVVLDNLLSNFVGEQDGNGLASTYQKLLAQEVGRIWRRTVSKEWEWQLIELTDNTDALYPNSLPLPAPA